MNQSDVFLNQAVQILFGFSHTPENHPDLLKHDHFQITFTEALHMLTKVFTTDWPQYLPEMCRTITQPDQLLPLMRSQHQAHDPDQRVKEYNQIRNIEAKDMVAGGQPRLLGLYGQKQQGKSTIAQFLVERHQYQEFSFAGVLKKGVAHLFSLSWSQMEDARLKETLDLRWGVTPRYLLQRVGTELFRQQITRYLPHIRLQKVFWIDHFLHWHQKLMETQPHCRMVVSDVRFQDEIEIIQDCGGDIWCVQRQMVPSTSSVDVHVSEQICTLPFNALKIQNLGSISDLYHYLENLLK
jgi:hypothetical protein